MTQNIHPTAQDAFDKNAQSYQQARPDYPPEIIPWLIQNFQIDNLTTAIDLGAGTGKFTRVLTHTDAHILAIEPVDDMAKQFMHIHPNIELIRAFSHAMPLKSQSVDLVMSAQAFHWFAHINTLQEIHRILKPNGHLGLIWNYRDNSHAWVQEISNFIATFEGNTPRFHHFNWKEVFNHQNLFKAVYEKRFSYIHRGTVEKVVCQRLLSTSFISTLTNTEKKEIQDHLERIIYQFLKKSPKDQINFPYHTYAYTFIRLDSPTNMST